MTWILALLVMLPLWCASEVVERALSEKRKADARAGAAANRTPDGLDGMAREALERARDEGAQRRDETENPPEAGGEAPFVPPLLRDPTPALAAFRAEVGEVPRAREVVLDRGNGAIGVFQDPTRPERLDRYVYRWGVVEAAEPVRVSQADIDALPDLLFELNRVNWAVVPQLVDAAFTRLGPEIEGADVTSVAVYRVGSVDPARPIFVVTLEGPEREGVLRATADGVVVDATVR